MRSEIVIVALPAIVVGSCAAHRLAVGQQPPMTERPAVIVLGYRSRRNGTPHPIQRWRVALAIHAIRRFGPATVVFSGGQTGGRTRKGNGHARSEAAVMAELMTRLMAEPMTGPNDIDVVLEERAISTWENVFLTMPMVEDATTVILVSDPLHAARARRYWLSQRPDDGQRVVVFGGPGFFDHWWLRTPTALHAGARAILTVGSRLTPAPIGNRWWRTGGR